MKSYYCQGDCNFQLEASGEFDNPHPGGCSIDDRIAANTNFENDDSLPLCPVYLKPLVEAK